MQSNLYPESPLHVPADFTKPSKSYKRHVLIASVGLLAFVFLYFGLSTWFLYKSYKLFANTFTGGRDGGLSFMAGLLTGFLGVFMIKAIFFFKRGGKANAIEIKREDQPELFEFIYKVADEAKTSRPHKVFVSDMVNACVFYDISIINLIFPTRKNLEIGLGLVNTLNLGEFKAILAHEFGHFTQRSMIIGRWVYISHSIAYQIIAKRDGLDAFLRTLSGVDFRVAWIGWGLSILVWSIRSLSETFFKLVIITERALSREMEFNADLVAVSLTGSDALIHSLYKLQVADDAYDESIAFLNKQLKKKNKVKNVFMLQSNSIRHMAEVLNNPAYGATPTPQFTDGSKFRVFKEQIAQPPKMWSTHPSNADREKNAKGIYIKSKEDNRSTWLLFKNTEELKEKVTDILYKETKFEHTLSIEETLALHDEEFGRSFLLPRYRGIYFNRPTMLVYKTPDDIYSMNIDPITLPEQWKLLYPEHIQQQLERWKNATEELEMLEGLHKKELDPNSEKITYKGREINRKELPEAIEQAAKEAEAAAYTLNSHDKLCRNVHNVAAMRIGNGWSEYLRSVATLVHYCEHTQKNIEVLNKHYLETLNVAVKIKNITSSEKLPLFRAANELHTCLEGAFSKSKQIILSGRLLGKMGGEQYESLLEPFQLGTVNDDNVNSWISVVQSWVNLAYQSLTTLKEAALDELLYTEACIEKIIKHETESVMAPEPVKLPDSYAKYDPAVKREVVKEIDLVSRIYNAEGMFPTIGRLAASAAIITLIIVLSFNIGQSMLVIYNGFPEDVMVKIKGKKLLVPRNSSEDITVEESGEMNIETTTLNGKEVEKFTADVSDDSKTYIYNVAGAAVIYKTFVYYGFGSVPPGDEPQLLGAKRWFTATADYYFSDPPKSIELQAGSTSIKSVLQTYLADPTLITSVITDKEEMDQLILTHALWEKSDSPDLLTWLYLLSETNKCREVLNKRLTANPMEIESLRMLQDIATEKEKLKICEQQRQLYLKNPDNADLYYLNCRCLESDEEKDKAFLDGNMKWPNNGWLAYASAHTYVQQENWKSALLNFNIVNNTMPGLRSGILEEMKRVSHLLGKDSEMPYLDANSAPYVSYVSEVEKSMEGDEDNLYAFKLLGEGKLKEALDRSRSDSSLYLTVLRLASVSDGVSEEIVMEAVSQGFTKSISKSSLIPLIALSIKYKLPLDTFKQTIQSLAPQKEKEFFQFIDHLKTARVEEADKLLSLLSAEMKGKAGLLGILILKDKAPKRWNLFASAFLFENEKPFRKNELKTWETEKSGS